MLGGLAIFVFGLQAIGSGLQEVTGKRANRVLEVLTSVPIVGMLVGTAVTIVVQSSTLVTVMVVSLVNSTMLNLKQAASVIMGANIGTTLTTQLVAFRITDWWVYCAAVGFSIYFFAKRKNIKTVGHVLFALALLLLGLSLMVDAMRPLRDSPAFQDMIVRFGANRIFGATVGMVFTAIVQSSTAVTAVIVAMTMEDLIPLEAALPLILGANIGTCFTAVLASIGGTTSAKRAAAVHVVFNTVGVVVFLIFLPQFQMLIETISPVGDVPRQAANAHMMFSVITTMLFLPFINQLIKLVTLMVPERATDSEVVQITKYINWKMVNTPAVALHLAQQELLYMADLAGQNVTLSIEGLIKKKKKKLKRMKTQEKLVNKLEKEIVRYLAAVSQTSMSKDVSVLHTGLLHASNDIERVSDHATNIATRVKEVIANKIDIPKKAIQEIEEIYAPIMEIYETSIRSVRENNTTLIPHVKALEMQIDIKEKEMRAAHIQRMMAGEISADGGIIFLDILSNFERISDHSVNISHLPQGKL